MEQFPQDLLKQLIDIGTNYGLKVIGGIVILVVGWMLSGSVSRSMKRLLSNRRRVDPTLLGFVASITRYVFMALVVIAVLNQFGVQTGGLIALIGASGIAIGLALQGTLSNIAAGFMLLTFRPFRVGQYIEVAGQAGTVQELTLFTTELATPDNVQIIVPNNAIWGQSIVNYSHHARRRVDFTLGIAYSDDIGQAIDIVEGALKDDTRCLQDPEPQIVVGELADSSVNLIVRVWVEATDYWPVKFDLTRAFKERFDRNGISIPFPQQELHISAQALRAVKGAA